MFYSRPLSIMIRMYRTSFNYYVRGGTKASLSVVACFASQQYYESLTTITQATFFIINVFIFHLPMAAVNTVS
jgi:hypothetical protein